MSSRLCFVVAGCAAATVVLGSDSSTYAQVELVVNGGFETGDLTGWSSDKMDNPTLPGGWTINDGTLRPNDFAAPTLPISGNYDAVSYQFAGGWRTLTSAPIVVPENLSLAVLSWSDRIRNWDLFHTVFAPGQNFSVEILDADFMPIGAAPVFSTIDGDPKLQVGPNHRSFDVTALLEGLAGQQIHLQFYQQDLNFLFNVNVDDVSLLVAIAQPAPDPTPDPVPDPVPDPDPAPEPEEPFEVLLDVKPGSDENPINLKVNSKKKGKGDAAGGVLPVAVLTTPDFDAAVVDVTQLALGDPMLAGVAAPIRGSYEDVDLDGDFDLVLHFNIPDMVALGAIDSQTTLLQLTGLAIDGTELWGIDTVQIVPDDSGKKNGKSGGNGNGGNGNGKSGKGGGKNASEAPPEDSKKNDKKSGKKK